MSVPIRLVEDSRARSGSRMEPREVRADALVGVPFVVVAAVLLATGLDEPVDGWLVALFVLTAAVVGRLEFETGAGFMVPTQLVFVPMLFLLAPAIVPLVVVAAIALDRMPDVIAGRMHPQRLLWVPCDAWYAVGPVVVFLLADVHGISGADWWVYVLALGAQFACELLGSTAHEWLAHGVPPKLQLGVLREVWLVDSLLAPVGLLAAAASSKHHYAFLLVLPAAMLLAVFARERRGRMGTAIELSATYRGTALLLGDVIAGDDALPSHGQGAVALALAIADELRLDEEQRRLVEFAAMLHDIGKMETPREILRKAGPLTEEEWEAMRAYTVDGQRMLDRVGGTLHDVGLIVRSAGERFAGDGYPDRLIGEEIPLPARVLAVAAAYGAMTTRRPYREPLSQPAALAELRANSGTQFDPAVVDAACTLLERGTVELSQPVGDAS